MIAWSRKNVSICGLDHNPPLGALSSCFNVPNITAFARGDYCFVDNQSRLDRAQLFSNFVKRIHNSGIITFINVADFFIKDGIVSNTLNGKLIYHDTNHISRNLYGEFGALLSGPIENAIKKNQ